MYAHRDINGRIGVFDVMRSDDKGNVYGIAYRETSACTEHYKFMATATPRGYRIELTQHNGRATVWEGPTFNMLLEVTAAVAHNG